MATEAQPILSFAYRAQSPDGQSISGTIDAATLAEANARLQGLPLQNLKLESAPRPPRPRALRGDDFFAFNQQLAQLTAAGLPVEQGLRLIASELHRGSMKRTLEMVAADLESGKSLPQAIDAHRRQFPPLYAALVDAGIRSGNLSRILLNLGRHLTLVRRLQTALWRTFSYPVVVLVAFCAMTIFLLTRVIPQFADIFQSWGANLPGATQVIMTLSHALTQQGLTVVAVAAAVVAAIALAVWITGRDQPLMERVLLLTPLIGPILRRNLISRWCDAVGLGVEAGLDLPAAINMADDAIGSSGLRADGQAIVAAVTAGRTIAESDAGRILPPMVIAALDLSTRNNDLPQGLATLSHLYEQQAEIRMGTVEVILTPIVIILVGLMIGAMLAAVFAPIISLINMMSSPMSFHHH
jgi:type IV pilus assembly protein PilC